MSSTKKEGKDVVIFVTKEDHEKPSEVQLAEPEQEPGLILDNGDINWNCPCLGGMASGPCGVDFREAFSCFHYSMAEPKGSECFEHFKNMQDCMVQYPNLYPSRGNDENELDDDDPIPDLVSGQKENSEQLAKDSVASSSKSK